jgi:GxxExxY protein
MMQQTEKRIKNDILTEQIIGSAIQVHKELGPGLLESAYEVCLCHELSLDGLKIERQKIIPISYKGIKLCWISLRFGC